MSGSRSLFVAGLSILSAWERSFESAWARRPVNLLDRLSRLTWRMSWSSISYVQRFTKRLYLNERPFLVARYLTEARRLRKLKKTGAATKKFKACLESTSIFHATWHEAVDELHQCRLEHMRFAALLLRKARTHMGMKEWNLAIEKFRAYELQLVGDADERKKVADDLDHCHQKLKQKAVLAMLLATARSDKRRRSWKKASKGFEEYLKMIETGDEEWDAAKDELGQCRAQLVAEEFERREREAAEAQAEQTRRRIAEQAERARREKEAAKAAEMERMRMKGTGHYATLWIRSNATLKEVTAAYKKLALKHHPDKNPGDVAAAERFRSINEAYQVLGDPDARYRYNRTLDECERKEHDRRFDFCRRRTTM